MTNLAATTLSGGTVTNFVGDIAVSSTGVVSASGLDDNRIYEVTIRVSQGGQTFTETFSVITGTNAIDTVDGVLTAGDDVIFAQGDGDIILAGSGNDHVFGQSADDQIYGGLGSDVLSGGGGNDKFMFDTTLNAATNVDMIQDFNASASDKIGLDDAIFSGFVGQTGLMSGQFVANAGGTAVGAGAQIIYNTATGQLIYDSNGELDGGATEFAVIDLAGRSGIVDAADFLIF
jgi:Ca2+-binding RTX toxin-like protein